MDADFSHNPKDIPLFLKQIENGADMVVGARYIKGGSIPSNWGIHRKILSFCANWIIRLGFMKPKVHEWTNGYRATKVWLIKDSLDHIRNYSGYVFQIALMDYAIKKGARLAEIPNNFIDRKYGKSKIFVSQYIVQILLYIFLHSSFVKFIIVGLLGFSIDFSFAYLFINKLHIPKAPANMFSAEVAIVFNFLLNNFWSFKDKKIIGGKFALIWKFLTFNLVSSGSVIIQGVGLSLALKFIGDKEINILGITNLHSWIAYKILIIGFFVIPYSYILYNKVIWKKNK